jgi:hypothetical protein
MPSIPNSASARTTSPALASLYSSEASRVPRGCRAPAARHVQVPSGRALVNSISMRRATAPTYNFAAVAQITVLPKNGLYCFVTVTKPQGCAWCGRPIEQKKGAGRPRTHCRRSCRQRDFEARKRARELGLAESDLIIARKAVERLDDLLFVLSCAVADVEADMALDASPDQTQRSLTWLLEASRPLLGASDRLRNGT